MNLRILTLLLLLTSFISPKVGRQLDTIQPILIPLGGGYDESYDAFIQAIVEVSEEEHIHILVIPIAYDKSRVGDLINVQKQVETNCVKATTEEQKCLIDLAPNIDNSTSIELISDLFSDDLTAIFLLSSDSGMAMEVLAGTSLENALSNAGSKGTIIAGTSYTGNILSRVMIDGYSDGFTQGQAFEFGAVDIWNSEGTRGLDFGSQNSIIDTHFFQDGRLGRLLNAITHPGGPQIGIGVDSYSGASLLNDQTVENIIGFYTVAILDVETYQASNGIQYRGKNNLLSLRNVLVHQLAPGDFYYDLSTLQHSLVPPSTQIDRSNNQIIIPENAGPIILSGGFKDTPDHADIIQHFVNLSGGEEANILIIADGFSTDRAARTAAEEYQTALGMESQVIAIPRAETMKLELPQDPSGIILIGEDPSLLHAEKLDDIKDLWIQGTPILAVDAAAVIMGVYYAALPPTPDNPKDAEAFTQETTLVGRTNIQPGLGLIDALIEVQALEDNRWGRLFSLAYNFPEYPALGLNRGTTLVLASSASTIEGKNVLVSLDLRNANLAVGSNDGFVIANGLIDVFAPGEVLRYQNADSESKLIHAATPVLPTDTQTPAPTNTINPTPTASLTPSPTLRATNTPRSTRTPLPPPFIPPPTDINLTSAMIIVGVFAVTAVFLGFWLNRKQL